jgi:hypothetical protein
MKTAYNFLALATRGLSGIFTRKTRPQSTFPERITDTAHLSPMQFFFSNGQVFSVISTVTSSVKVLCAGYACFSEGVAIFNKSINLCGVR